MQVECGDSWLNFHNIVIKLDNLRKYGESLVTPGECEKTSKTNFMIYKVCILILCKSRPPWMSRVNIYV